MAVFKLGRLFQMALVSGLVVARLLVSPICPFKSIIDLIACECIFDLALFCNLHKRKIYCHFRTRATWYSVIRRIFNCRTGNLVFLDNTVFFVQKCPLRSKTCQYRIILISRGGVGTFFIDTPG